MEANTTEPIAVIGFDLKFPGDANTPEKFYDFLLSGRSALSEVPKGRYNLDAFYHPDPQRSGTVCCLSLSPPRSSRSNPLTQLKDQRPACAFLER